MLTGRNENCSQKNVRAILSLMFQKTPLLMQKIIAFNQINLVKKKKVIDKTCVQADTSNLVIYTEDRVNISP